MKSADERVLELLASGAIDADTAEVLLDAISETDAALPTVAILGSAVRLPGAKTRDDMWRLIKEGRPVTSVFPPERLELVLGATDGLRDKYLHLRGHLDDDKRAWGGWLEGVDEFDPGAFGLSEFEATFVGPYERMMLELSSEAVAASGITTSELRGSRTGIFLAHQPDAAFPYIRLFDDPDERTFLSGINANVAYRVAYTYDLKGPVMNVDTTCSSSLVAFHLARRSLQLGECDTAIVAGLNMDLFPFQYEDSAQFVLSPRHLCNAYDSSADGTSWGEGGVAVVLRRLADAEHDGNVISASVVGSAVASDGTSNGMAAPSPSAHAAVVRAALVEAGLSARDIGYLEGHGAGTELGDQVELSALTEAFRQDTTDTMFCSLGSVKTITGHLKDAAGLTGLMAALLRIEHGFLPALASLKSPIPAVPWASSPFVLDAQSRHWKSDAPRRAGISSLGLSGTNAHVIIEQYAPTTGSVCPAGDVPILLSAPSRWSLWEFIDQLAIDLDPALPIRDVAATIARRELGSSRIAIVANDMSSLLDKLGRLTSVRSFERIPDNFYDQGIFIADDTESATESRRHVDCIPTGLRELITGFVGGEQVSAEYRAITRGATTRTLPVAPFTRRRIWPREAQSAYDVSDLFFKAVWSREPIPASRRNRQQTVIVVASDSVLATELGLSLAVTSESIVTVMDACEFRRTGPSSFEGPLDQVATYDAVWDGLGEGGLDRVTSIVFGPSWVENLPMQSLDALRESQRIGVLSLFSLAKSLTSRSVPQNITIAALAPDAQPLDANVAYDPARTTLFGLLRVLSQEMPTISELCIDHDYTTNPSSVAERITAELAVPVALRHQQVAYRGGARLVRTIERQSDDRPATTTPLEIRPGGTYVIAGGTGNLGPQLALFLAEHGAGSIVLLSRSGLPSRDLWGALKDQHDTPWPIRLDALEKAEAAGCTITALQCDITNPGVVDSTFQTIHERFGRVDGGYMLTKQLFHQWIHELDPDDFKIGIDNRVVGTWLIADALKKSSAGHLILFSSISSMSGTKGASECASVNQFLDSAAPYLTGHGLNTYTINWPLVLHTKASFGAKTPIPPIDYTEFHAALARFALAPHQLDIVARFDLEEAHYLRPVLKIPLSESIWSEAVAVVEARRGARSSSEPTNKIAVIDEVDYEAVVARAWKTALGDSPVSGDQFFAAGGTSLSVIRFVHQVDRSLDHGRLNVADVYAHPTYDGLVSFLTNPAPALSESAGADLDDIFTRVERGELSAQQAADVLLNGAGGTA